ARREYLLGRVENAAAGVPRGGQRGRGLYGRRHDVPTGTAPYPQPARAVNDFARRRGYVYRAVREPSAGWRRGAKGKARRAATSGAATRRRKHPPQSQGQPPAGVQVPSIFTLELLKPPGRSNSTPENPSSSPTADLTARSPWNTGGGASDRVTAKSRSAAASSTTKARTGRRSL